MSYMHVIYTLHTNVVFQWDEALMTMTVGEKAEIVIQPEWAYGKKGLEGKYSFCPNVICTVGDFTV